MNKTQDHSAPNSSYGLIISQAWDAARVSDVVHKTDARAVLFQQHERYIDAWLPGACLQGGSPEGKSAASTVATIKNISILLSST
jgi:hypothetical protein